MISETTAYLRVVARAADRVAKELEQVEEVMSSWDDVTAAAQSIHATVKRLKEQQELIIFDDDLEMLTWAAEALVSYAAKGLDIVRNPHNDTEEMAQHFVNDPELLARVWTRVGELRSPQHPLERK